MTQYTFSIRVDAAPATAEQRVRDALADQGFGILTEIDVQATLKEKLGTDMPPYKILGACNPSLAYQAIQADDDLGALLPCNIVVRAHPAGGAEVLAADPEVMLTLSDRAEVIVDVAREAKKRIGEALEAAAT